MASSGNFCTLNPVAQLGGSTDENAREAGMSDGNLEYINITGNTAVGTFGLTSGKWYYEVRVNSFNADNGMTIGFCNQGFNLDAELGYNSPSSPSGGQGFGWYADTNKLIYGPGDGGGTYNKAWGGGTKATDGDIIGFFLDVDNLKFWAAKNNTVFNSGNPANGTGHGFGTGGDPHNVAILPGEALYPAIGNWSVADGTVTFNFGQDSTFGGAITAAGNTDANGFGDFKYEPPAGFLAICSANLPIADEINPSEGKNPTEFHDTITYTGTGTARSVDGLNFKPDWVLIKNRDAADGWLNQNSVSGVGKTHEWNDDGPYEDETDCITAFNSDGFALGTDHKVNANTEKYVAYCWKKSADAGFDIVEYSGTGATNNVSHSLGATPDCIMLHLKSGSDWDSTMYFNSPNMGATNGIFMTLANAKQNTAYVPAVSSTTFRPDTSANSDGRGYVAYLFKGIDGYSKFGEFEGNGNAQGPFIFTGFRPKFVFIKAIDASENWQIRDTARQPYNSGTVNRFYWNTNAAEGTASTASPIDFLANGFKIRGSNSEVNSNTIIYGAWADVPFKYNSAL